MNEACNLFYATLRDYPGLDRWIRLYASFVAHSYFDNTVEEVQFYREYKVTNGKINAIKIY